MRFEKDWSLRCLKDDILEAGLIHMAQIARTIGGEMLHCTRVVGMCVYVATIGGGNDTASCLVAGACADGVGEELFFRHQRVREEHCPCADIECMWVRVCVCVRAHTQYAYVRSQKSVNDVPACPCAAAAQKGTRWTRWLGRKTKTGSWTTESRTWSRGCIHMHSITSICAPVASQKHRPALWREQR